MAKRRLDPHTQYRVKGGRTDSKNSGGHEEA